MEKNESEWNRIKQGGSAHYKADGIEPLDLYRAGGILRPFAIGCIIKYAFRQRAAVSASDCDKIIHYAQILKICGEKEDSPSIQHPSPYCFVPESEGSPCPLAPPSGSVEGEEPDFPGRPRVDLKAEVTLQAADWMRIGDG